MKITSIQSDEERLNVVHHGTVAIVRETYHGFSKHATFIDVEHGTWNARVIRVLSGQGHRARMKHDLIKLGILRGRAS